MTVDAENLTADRLADVLGLHLYTYSDEASLHTAISTVFSEYGITATHEARATDTERPDFICGTVCVEVKIKGSTTKVFSQLQRYAHLPNIAELLLVTTVADHTTLPDTVAGKPLTVLLIGGAW